MNVNDQANAGRGARWQGRREVWALAALALLFLLLLIASWQRWTQPLLDHGREMNLPVRILAGEQLYADVQFLYGPFAPYFNALLYRLCGVHLAVLHASGAVCAALILLLLYWLARQFMNVWEAAATTGLVLVICALKATANYVQPYAYAALYALVLALGALCCTARYLVQPNARWLIGAGTLAGLALIAKPEIAAAALAAAVAALALDSLTARRLLWRELCCFAWPVLALLSAVYSFILSRVSWRVLLADNHVLFGAMPPQLIYFNRHISGLAQWPASLWFSLAGLGVFLLWLGVSLTLGALVAQRCAEWRSGMKTGLAVLLAGVMWRAAALRWLNVPSDVTPFASAVFVLPVLIAVLAWRVRRLKQEERLLLVLSAFSLTAVLRALFNVTTTGPYTPFFIPVLIVVYLYLLLRTAPSLLIESTTIQRNARRAALCLLALLIVGMALNSARRFRRLNTFKVSAPRGQMIVPAEYGEPLAAALRYVEQQTAPDDYVLALPIATTINFLTARRYPLREEIVHPGFLTGAQERDAIERIKARNVKLILIANLDTSEFRDRRFGLDYNQELFRWITANYRLTQRFAAAGSTAAQLGDEGFFILAYERLP